MSEPSEPPRTHGPRRSSRGARYGERLLVAAIAWGVLAFGAVYPWAYWPLAAACVLVAWAGLSAAPAPGRLGLTPLATMFCLFGAAAAMQLVPVPLDWLGKVSPETPSVLAKLYLGGGDTHALSIAPARTLTGLILFASNALLVLGAARLLSIRGGRRFAEAIASLTILVALVGIVQKPMYAGYIYGFWKPLLIGNPFGPFVNRNHFAGWMLMALPMTIGLCGSDIARAAPGARPTWRDRVLWFASPQANRLLVAGVAAVLAAVSLVLTASRSGLAALVLTLVIIAAVGLRRQQGAGRKAVALGFLILLVVLVVSVAGDVMASRLSKSALGELGDRRGAWSDTVNIAAKFPLAGTGLDTFGVATVLYEPPDLPVHYAEAHNDYLQLAAEGGILLVAPALICAALFVIAVRKRFVEETSATAYWLRVGAVTGLVAIAFQEMVDFSLQMPGNAVLFSALCAMALHRAPARAAAHSQVVAD